MTTTLDLNHGPIAKCFQHLAHENAAKSRAILVEADQLADTLGDDDTLLDSLLVGLNL
ncbi:MAG TPA: hypothetical protein VGZ26_11580 [Pirellulales bacterium]|nr:hypothetical protein [Pirellulales bacterium]